MGSNPTLSVSALIWLAAPGIRAIHVDGLEVSVESAIDLNGFLQLAPTAAGLDDVRITMRVRTDADDDTLEEIRRIVTHASPVYDSVRRPVSIESRVVRA